MSLGSDFSRALHILKLDAPAIDTVARDTRAFLPGLFIASFAAIIGSLPQGITPAIAAAIVAPVSLFCLVAILFILAKLFKGQGTYMSIWRPASHACLIAAVGLVGFIPAVGVVVAPVAVVYLLILWVAIVRTTQRLSTAVAAIVVLLSVLCNAFVLLALLIVLAGSLVSVPFTYTF